MTIYTNIHDEIKRRFIKTSPAIPTTKPHQHRYVELSEKAYGDIKALESCGYVMKKGRTLKYNATESTVIVQIMPDELFEYRWKPYYKTRIIDTIIDEYYAYDIVDQQLYNGWVTYYDGYQYSRHDTRTDYDRYHLYTRGHQWYRCDTITINESYIVTESTRSNTEYYILDYDSAKEMFDDLIHTCPALSTAIVSQEEEWVSGKTVITGRDQTSREAVMWLDMTPHQQSENIDLIKSLVDDCEYYDIGKYRLRTSE